MANRDYYYTARWLDGHDEDYLISVKNGVCNIYHFDYGSKNKLYDKILINKVLLHHNHKDIIDILFDVLSGDDEPCIIYPTKWELGET